MNRWGVVGVAAVAAALLFYGSLSDDYWRIGGKDGIGAGLATLTDFRGLFALVSHALVWVGPLTGVAAVAGMLLLIYKDEGRVLYGAGWGGAFVVLGGLLAWLLLRDRSFGIPVAPGIGGMAAWIGGATAAVLGLKRRAEPVAVTLPSQRPRTTDALVPPTSKPGLRPASSPLPALDTPRSEVRSSHRQPKRQRMADVGPSAADAARSTLRFVARSCQIGEQGLAITTDDNQQRTLAWSDIAKLHARRMPPDPPFEKVLFVDLVPPTGAPVRLLPTTKVNYDALPHREMSSKANLRLLGIYLRDQNPALDWSESAGFFERNEIPIAFATLRQFADYDATLG